VSSYKPGRLVTTIDSSPTWDPDHEPKPKSEDPADKPEVKAIHSETSRGHGKPLQREGVVANPMRRTVTDRGRVAIVAPRELAHAAHRSGTGTYADSLVFNHGSRLSYFHGDPADLQIHGIEYQNEVALMAYREEIIKGLPPQPEGEIRPSHLLNPKSQLRYRFLTAVERLGTIARACEVCGLSNWDIEKAKHSAPEFARAVDQARSLYAATIQEEAYRRAVHGVDVPIVSRNREGNPEVIGTQKVYSDALTALLLKATNPEQFSTRTVKHEGTITHGHMPTIDANKLRALSSSDRDKFRELLMKLQPDNIPPPEIGEHVPEVGILDVPSTEEDDNE